MVVMVVMLRTARSLARAFVALDSLDALDARLRSSERESWSQPLLLGLSGERAGLA